MSIASRLKRLETAMARPPESGRPKTFDQLLADSFALEDWLAERGFADAWAAVEAGETGPVRMEQALADAAATAYRERIFRTIEKELNANRLPSEELMNIWRRLKGTSLSVRDQCERVRVDDGHHSSPLALATDHESHSSRSSL